jgi:hypothetical protein
MFPSNAFPLCCIKTLLISYTFFHANSHPIHLQYHWSKSSFSMTYYFVGLNFELSLILKTTSEACGSKGITFIVGLQTVVGH